MICPRPTGEGTDGPEARSSSSQSQQMGEDEINWLPEVYDPHRTNTQNSYAYRTKSEQVRNRQERQEEEGETYFSKRRYRIPSGREHRLWENELPRGAEYLLLPEN